MVKSTATTETQASRAKKQDATANDPTNTGHPLLKHSHQANDFMNRVAGGAAKDEIIIERIEEWKEVLNRLASSPDGQHFLRMMIKFSGLYTLKKGVGAERLLLTEGKQAFYLEYVYPYLDPTNRKELS